MFCMRQAQKLVCFSAACDNSLLGQLLACPCPAAAAAAERIVWSALSPPPPPLPLPFEPLVKDNRPLDNLKSGAKVPLLHQHGRTRRI